MSKQYRVVFSQYGTKLPTEANLYKVIVNDGRILYVDGYYYDPMKENRWRTDEEHYEAVKNLIGDRENVKIEIPAHAASLICCFKRHGYEVIVNRGDINA